MGSEMCIRDRFELDLKNVFGYFLDSSDSGRPDSSCFDLRERFQFQGLVSPKLDLDCCLNEYDQFPS